MRQLITFDAQQIAIVHQAAAVAEDRVSDAYKMSTSQWLKGKFDIKTLQDLEDSEIVNGPFAQVIRYVVQPASLTLGSSSFDFYKICLQDHAILAAMESAAEIKLLPFALYILAHELIHIVRFSKFLQNFEASPAEQVAEEGRVHIKTRKILSAVRLAGLDAVFDFFANWYQPIDDLRSP